MVGLKVMSHFVFVFVEQVWCSMCRV